MPLVNVSVASNLSVIMPQFAFEESIVLGSTDLVLEVFNADVGDGEGVTELARPTLPTEQMT